MLTGRIHCSSCSRDSQWYTDEQTTPKPQSTSRQWYCHKWHLWKPCKVSQWFWLSHIARGVIYGKRSNMKRQKYEFLGIWRFATITRFVRTEMNCDIWSFYRARWEQKDVKGGSCRYTLSLLFRCCGERSYKHPSAVRIMWFFEVIPDCCHSHSVTSQFRFGKCWPASTRKGMKLGNDWVLESVVCRSQGCCQNHVCATTACGLTVPRFWCQSWLTALTTRVFLPLYRSALPTQLCW